MLHSGGGRIPAGVLPNYSLVKSVLSWWSVLTCCVHQIELRLHAKPEGRNLPKTDASRWFSLYRMLCLSPQRTSGRHRPHSIVSPCFTLLATCFPFHIICSQVLMPATFRRSPEVPCPEHINKRECQTVVISVFFWGLLNKRLLVWLFLWTWYRRGWICFCTFIIWGTTCRCNQSMRRSLAELCYRQEVLNIRCGRTSTPTTVTSWFWSPVKQQMHQSCGQRGR